MRKTKPTCIPYTSWANQLRVNWFLHLAQGHRLRGPQPLVSAFGVLVAIGTLRDEVQCYIPVAWEQPPKTDISALSMISLWRQPTNTTSTEVTFLLGGWRVLRGRRPHRAGGFG